MPEYAVLDKDTIKSKIMPYLSIAKEDNPPNLILLRYSKRQTLWIGA